MNNNLDFLNKTEINSFVYSTASDQTQDCKNVVIDGRQYTKWGRNQVVTFVGMMYEVQNLETRKTTNFVTIGISKQHPQDIKHDRKIATETARVNAITNPIMIMYDVSPDYDNYTFKRMMELYVDTMRLDFVLTKEELRKVQNDEFNNDWSFYLNKQE